MSFIKGQLLNLFLSLVPQLTRGIRDELLTMAKTWNIAAQNTDTKVDDILSALCVFMLNVGNPASTSALTDEMIEGLNALYCYVKKTPNPYDDIAVGILFNLAGLETPAC